MESISQHYLESVNKQFRNYKGLADKALAQIEPGQLFIQPNENSNSIAVIVKHMAGNMISRWTDFFTTDGEKPNRNRDEEFENNVSDKQLLILYWEQGWKVFFETLHSLKPEDLQKTIYIRKEAHSVMEAVSRQLTHYAYHVGQIVYAAKMLKKTEWNSLSIPKKKS